MNNKVIVINSPYILLAHQLLRNTARYLTLEHRMRVRYLNVNSGQFNRDDIIEFYRKAGLEPIDVKTTTKPEEIREIYGASNEPLVISSTYDSAIKIKESGVPIDIQFNDEAHFLVTDQEEFQDAIQLNGNPVINFTATEKLTDSDDGFGMNNKSLFGSRRFYRSPREMILADEILPPAIHIVSTIDPSHDDLNYAGYAKCIRESFARHKEVVKEASAFPDDIEPKLLVTIPGTEQLRGVLDSGVLDDLNVPIYAISSELGAYIKMPFQEPERYSYSGQAKERFLERLNRLGDIDQAIIFQIKMLTTGIDVPGITGTLIFKNLCEISFLQNLGRACRLSAKDRQKIYADELARKSVIATEAKELSKLGYVKPMAWVLIPEMMPSGEDFRTRYTRLINAFKTNEVLDIKNLVVIDDDRGIDDEEDLEKRKLKKLTRENIGEIIHELEELDFIADENMYDELALTDLARALEENAEDVLNWVDFEIVEETKQKVIEPDVREIERPTISAKSIKRKERSKPLSNREALDLASQLNDLIGE